jgi:hypothetical protein
LTFVVGIFLLLFNGLWRKNVCISLFDDGRSIKLEEYNFYRTKILLENIDYFSFEVIDLSFWVVPLFRYKQRQKEKDFVYMLTLREKDNEIVLIEHNEHNHRLKTSVDKEKKIMIYDYLCIKYHYLDCDKSSDLHCLPIMQKMLANRLESEITNLDQRDFKTSI